MLKLLATTVLLTLFTSPVHSLADSVHDNIRITELEGSGLDLNAKLKSEFERRLAAVVRNDFSVAPESVEVTYSCTYSELVAIYCSVNVVTEFGSYGAYAIEYGNEWVQVLKKKISL